MNITELAPVANESVEASGVSNALVFFVLMIIAAVGIIILQVYLSRKENKWLGLILPIISFCISLMALLAVLLFSANTGTLTTTVNGEIVEQTTEQVANISSIIASAIYIFVLYNIPTGILLAIYAACRGKRNRQRALEKMSIQDLE